MFVEYKTNIEYNNEVLSALNLTNIYEQNFREQVSNIGNSINNNYQKGTVLRELHLVTKTFEEVQSAHNKSAVLKRADEDKSLGMWDTKSYTDFGRISKIVDYYLRTEREREPKTASILMEKIPLPKFDGNIRKYPQFIKDFKQLVMPNLKSVEAPFTLRECLSENVKSGLSACDDDLQDMLSFS